MARTTLSPSAMKPEEFNRTRHIYLNDQIEYTITLPEPPSNYKNIQGWDKPIQHQKWFIPEDIPSEEEFDTWDKEARIRFLKREMKRRKEGYWFYCHGNIEYLTGHHYFYLTYWRIDGIVPYWKDSDSTFFYIQKHAEELDYCLGWMQVTNRRDGKTGKSTAILFNSISMEPNANGGIQSKTNQDAKGIFRKLILSWQKLPFYMKPTDSGESFPSKELKFQEPSRRSSKGGRKDYKKVLNSKIDFAAATETAYDGSKLRFYYDDEYGKTEDADAHERWLIVKECLVQGRNVIGKSLHTTTAEEMEEKGGLAAKIMWDDSNLSKAIDQGRDFTISGLLRWFKPAYLGLEGFIDEYGYSVVEDPKKPLKGIDGGTIKMGAKSYLKKRRLGLKGAQLASEKRKYPFNIEEAFIEDGKESPFDVIRLNEQKSYNTDLTLKVQVGNFSWDIMNEGEVVWQPTEKGRWKLVHMPDPNSRNKKVMNRSKYTPGNTDMYVSGCDPFDHRFTTDGRKSNAASYIFRKLDPLDQENSHMFVCEYVNRPATPEMFYEDLAKQCVFYGCKLLCENNKPGLINWFINNGFEGYLMRRPAQTHTDYSKNKQQEYGIPMNSEAVRSSAIEITQTYIYENVGYNEETGKIGKVFFNDLLTCWLKFNPAKWTDYDEFVAASLCLFAARSYRPKQKERVRKNFVKTYRPRTSSFRR